MNPNARTVDPAQGAAELLRRFGMAVLGLVLPCAAFYSRRAAIMLAPLGAILLFMATVIDPAEPIGERLRAFVRTPGFFIILGLTAWGGMSVAWAPFPVPASERFFNSLALVALTVAALAAMPGRMRAPALYLLPIGAFAGVLVACLVALEMRGALRLGLLNDPSLAQRGLATMTLLAPVALGWLLSRGRAPEAIALAVGLASSTFVIGDGAALVTLAVALGAFVAVKAAPQLAAPALSIMAAVVILGAPAIPFLAKPVAAALGYPEAAALFGALGDSVRQEADRLITGHGLESAPRAVVAGILPPMQGPPLIIGVWYDLGVLGAAALAAMALRSGLRASGRSIDVTAADVALTMAATTQMVLGVAAMQAWWLSTIAAAAIAVYAVANGQFRTRRPRARLLAPRAGPAAN